MSATLRVILALLVAMTILGIAAVLSSLVTMELTRWSTEARTDPALFLMAGWYVRITLAAAAGLLSALVLASLAGPRSIRTAVVLAGVLLVLAVVDAMISYGGAAEKGWTFTNQLSTWAGPILAYDVCLVGVVGIVIYCCQRWRRDEV